MVAPIYAKWLDAAPALYKVIWELPSVAGLATSPRHELPVQVRSGTLKALRVYADNAATMNLYLFQESGASRNDTDNVLRVDAIAQYFQIATYPIIFDSRTGTSIYAEVDNSSAIPSGVITLELLIEQNAVRG